MSTNEDEYFPQDSGYGFCPICGTPLENFGAASHGDGDIFDEIHCPDEWCSYEGYEEHASYCDCIDCNPYAQLDNNDDDMLEDPTLNPKFNPLI